MPVARLIAIAALLRQSELLEERLSKLPPRQIVRFHEIRRQMDERAYSWDVWGAA